MSLLEQYRAGERDEVWTQLRWIGDDVRHPDVLPDAQAVCDEMARRARSNVETIVARLQEQGHEFIQNDDEGTPATPHFDPSPDAADLAAWLDEKFGLPLAVGSWMRIVGDVWLVGNHPGWRDIAEADGLVLEFEGMAFGGDRRADVERDLAEYAADGHPANGIDEPYPLYVAADRLTKANISGGGPYAFELPDRTAEGVLHCCWGPRDREVEIGFVDYLNRVFARGGFPYDEGPEDEREAVRRSLAEGLLPL